MMSPTFQQLRTLSDDELVKLYDDHTENTVVGLAFIRDGIARRSQDRQTGEMLRLTRTITRLTWFIALLTWRTSQRSSRLWPARG